MYKCLWYRFRYILRWFMRLVEPSPYRLSAPINKSSQMTCFSILRPVCREDRWCQLWLRVNGIFNVCLVSFEFLCTIIMLKRFENIWKFLSYWYFRYLMVTELYMVERWERAVCSILYKLNFVTSNYFSIKKINIQVCDFT